MEADCFEGIFGRRGNGGTRAKQKQKQKQKRQLGLEESDSTRGGLYIWHTHGVTIGSPFSWLAAMHVVKLWSPLLFVRELLRFEDH